MGLRQRPRMGDVVPAAAPQLPPHPADQVGAAGVRPQVPHVNRGMRGIPVDEERILAEMERHFRAHDRRFAARIDRMNATGANVARGHFSREVSRRELVLLVLATLLTAVVMGLLTFLAGQD